MYYLHSLRQVDNSIGVITVIIFKFKTLNNII